MHDNLNLDLIIIIIIQDGDYAIADLKGKNDEGRGIQIASFNDDDTLKKLMVKSN